MLGFPDTRIDDFLKGKQFTLGRYGANRWTKTIEKAYITTKFVENKFGKSFYKPSIEIKATDGEFYKFEDILLVN